MPRKGRRKKGDPDRKPQIKWTPALQKELLEDLSQGIAIKDAIRAHGISRTTVNRHRREDPAFDELYKEAVEDGNDEIRNEIRRRAIDGVLEPVYHEGAVVGRKRKYSDDLLKFLARARMEEFREQASVNHNISLDGAAERLISKLDTIIGASSAIPIEGTAEESE